MELLWSFIWLRPTRNAFEIIRKGFEQWLEDWRWSSKASETKWSATASATSALSKGHKHGRSLEMRLNPAVGSRMTSLIWGKRDRESGVDEVYESQFLSFFFCDMSFKSSGVFGPIFAKQQWVQSSKQSKQSQSKHHHRSTASCWWSAQWFLLWAIHRSWPPVASEWCRMDLHFPRNRPPGTERSPGSCAPEKVIKTDQNGCVWKGYLQI